MRLLGPIVLGRWQPNDQKFKVTLGNTGSLSWVSKQNTNKNLVCCPKAALETHPSVLRRHLGYRLVRLRSGCKESEPEKPSSLPASEESSPSVCSACHTGGRANEELIGTPQPAPVWILPPLMFESVSKTSSVDGSQGPSQGEMSP